MCGRLRPESAAMAGVLSRDAPDIEVSTAALGWEVHGGARGPGAAPGTELEIPEVSPGETCGPGWTQYPGTRTWSLRRRLKSGRLTLP